MHAQLSVLKKRDHNPILPFYQRGPTGTEFRWGPLRALAFTLLAQTAVGALCPFVLLYFHSRRLFW